MSLSAARTFSISVAFPALPAPQAEARAVQIGDCSKDPMLTLISIAGEGCENRQSASATGAAGWERTVARALAAGARFGAGKGFTFGGFDRSSILNGLPSMQVGILGLSRQ